MLYTLSMLDFVYYFFCFVCFKTLLSQLSCHFRMVTWSRLLNAAKDLPSEKPFTNKNPIFKLPCNQKNWGKSNYNAARLIRSLVAKASGSTNHASSSTLKRNYITSLFPKILQTKTNPTWKTLPSFVAKLSQVTSFSPDEPWTSKVANKTNWKSKRIDRADAIKSLIRKASNNNTELYLSKLFPKIVKKEENKFEECLKKILKELEKKVNLLNFRLSRHILMVQNYFVSKLTRMQAVYRRFQ